MITESVGRRQDSISFKPGSDLTTHDPGPEFHTAALRSIMYVCPAWQIATSVPPLVRMGMGCVTNTNPTKSGNLQSYAHLLLDPFLNKHAVIASAQLWHQRRCRGLDRRSPSVWYKNFEASARQKRANLRATYLHKFFSSNRTLVFLGFLVCLRSLRTVL